MMNTVMMPIHRLLTLLKDRHLEGLMHGKQNTYKILLTALTGTCTQIKIRFDCLQMAVLAMHVFYRSACRTLND